MNLSQVQFLCFPLLGVFIFLELNDVVRLKDRI